MNLFDEKPDENHDVPLSILREISELRKYYYSPGMKAARLEFLIDHVGDKADKIIAERKP